MFVGTDADYKMIEQMKKDPKWAFGTCYDITWGFILPCESGVIWEQQTDGCCCHHVYIEGILIPLRDVVDIEKMDERYHGRLLVQIPELNYEGSNKVGGVWKQIHKCSHIDFKEIPAPKGMPRNEEAFQWIIYYGHDEGWGQSFNIEAWKGKPIVMVYENCD